MIYENGSKITLIYSTMLHVDQNIQEVPATPSEWIFAMKSSMLLTAVVDAWMKNNLIERKSTFQW